MRYTLPDGYRLRRAKANELERLQDVDVLASALFAPLGLIDEDPADPQPVPYNALKFAWKQKMLFTMEHRNDGPVGFAMAARRYPDLYLDQISVNPSHGRMGLGRALVGRVIEAADRLRCGGVVLSTFRDVSWNAPFYAKLGFKQIADADKLDWMLDLEERQSNTMDVSLRCFMRRPGRYDGRLLAHAFPLATPPPRLNKPEQRPS